MGRNTLRTAAVVTLAALFTGTAATATYAAAPEEVNTPAAPVAYEAGRYIVLLDAKPAATYVGGESGLAPTQPDKGKRLDPSDANVKKYTAFLKKQQKAVADEVAIAPDTQYVLTLNGFAADLSATEAARLAKVDGVQSVTPDFIRHPAAVPSTEFLGLEGETGVWAATGGVETAGAGVVVGVIDTGIASKNPSFAGAPLGTTPGTEPYLDGNAVVFDKADGSEFRSERVTGEGWTNEDYSTKLIGAQYFSEGAAATGYDFTADYLSPQDWDGHGSHTASTAAGNHDVAANVEGIDFGTISGVAPAAKVAAYKACYAGPDVLVTTDDICAGSDLLAAIEAATSDGVDVINYSIGGGSATTTFAAEDYAFLNAAAAGIFIAVSAGNSGPDAATADHASPWYTTVAASTVPTYEGTVTTPGGFTAVGASVSVPFGETVTDDAVYAGDIPAAGAAPADAALCMLDTLDAAAAAGKIVVCDRGGNARVEKSQAVEEAGGVGMVLVNVTPGSLDNDFHSVPTVHIQSTFRDELLAAVRAGTQITLHGGNITDDVTPTPVVAGFSSRGPMNADGSDILKPDISAPGVAILAAEGADADGATWGFKSGTSMSSPHIAGLAALYLGERPNATPDEIKSAMMTTAYNTVNDDGSDSTDPFAQGAGHVDPTRFFEPGLLYLNGPADWLAFLEGKGYADVNGIDPIDGSDLNLASISIGSLAYSQTVTRTVTATEAGTYTAAVDVPGIETSVSPSSVTLAAGESASVEITFTTGDAQVESWSTGFLTWTGPETVRSPIAVFPVTADAPLEIAGTGLSGSADVTITPGVTGQLPLNLSGLSAMQLLLDPEKKVKGHTGNELSGGGERVTFFVTVPEGTEASRFDLDSSDDTGSDLDLFVYRVVSETDTRYYEAWQSASGSADEQVTVFEPTAGLYMVQADVYATTKPMTWDLTYANVGTDKTTGSFTASPNPLTVVAGTPVDYTLSWSKLKKDTTYLGVVRYGESDVRTVVTVESGSKK